LRDYIVEKSKGQVCRGEIITIGLDLLRSADAGRLRSLLLSACGRKVVIDGENYSDLDSLTTILRELISEGHNFLFRTAASLTRSIIDQRPIQLLRSKDLMDDQNRAGHGGIIFVGSHTQKTTAQLEQLLAIPGIQPFEFRIKAVFDRNTRQEQHQLIVRAVDKALAAGQTCVIFTERQLHSAETGEKSLQLSVAVSDALSAIANSLTLQPAFVVAKGGITSYDIAVKGLGVKKAMVAGQIAPGVPVWILSSESRFPGVPYIICPGNTGEPDLLACIYRELGEIDSGYVTA